MDLPVIQFVPEDNSKQVEIGIFYRGRLENETEGQLFHNLLQENSNVATPVALSPGQIKSLCSVLDLTGFNQYSYPPAMSGYAADFHLRSAQILLLNGRAVLKVDGEFRADQKPDSYYGTYYVDADNKGRKIYEIYLQSSDRDTYLRTLPVFNEITSSIEWQTIEKTTLF